MEIKGKITDVPKLDAFFTSGVLVTITIMNWRDGTVLMTEKVTDDNETQSRLQEHPNQHAPHPPPDPALPSS